LAETLDKTGRTAASEQLVSGYACEFRAVVRKIPPERTQRLGLKMKRGIRSWSFC
jgi:hypothetical protein